MQEVRKIQQRQILRSTPTLRQQQQRRRGRTQHQSRSPDDAHKEEIQPDNHIRLIQPIIQYRRPSSGEDNPDSDREEEDPEETDLRAEIGREIERLREQTPAPTTQIGCSTGRASNPPQPDVQGTPIHRQTTPDTGNETAEPGKGTTGKIWAEQISYFAKNQIKSESEPRRSERIKSARRVVKLSGVEYF